MASSNKVDGREFLKSVARNLGSGSLDYVKSSMRTTTSTITDAKSTIHEVNSRLKTTTSDIIPRVRQLKNQVNIRSLMNWFTEKENSYSDDYSNGDLGDWDDDTPQSEIAEQQISESKSSANQISGAITESIHKSIESSIDMTANISSRIDAQTATISSGFDKVSGLLSNLLEVVTKNTAAIIETQISSNSSLSDNMLDSGRFNLSDYKKIIKDNLSQTQAGIGISAAQAMLSTMFTGGKAPSAKELVSFGISGALDKFVPNLRKNLVSIDDAINDSIMQSLVQLGNSKWENGPKSMIAKLFGIDGSRKEVNTDRADLSLKATPFDTVTKESIIGAIPGYLRKILVAVGGPDLVYDYRSRSFKTQGQIASEFRKQSSSFDTGSLRGASDKLRNALGDDSWTNMVFDGLISYIGSELDGTGKFNDIDKKFRDPKVIEDIIKNHIFDGNMTEMDETNAKIFSDRLSKIDDNRAYKSLQTQAATNNARRNKKLPEYISMMQSMGVDLSFIKDDPNEDIKSIFKDYGRGDIASISNVTSDDSITGVNYTNTALYEIFRRLDTGINVFQVGSDNSRRKPFKRLGDKYLPKPSKHKAKSEETLIDESGQSIITSSVSGRDDPNLLRNNTDTEGNQEDLSKGQRFMRWGKSRLGQLGSAMIHGNPGEVKDAFMSAMGDVTGIASDAMKRGMSTINEKFGNVSGYISHKLFGSEYTYIDTEVDPTTGETKKYAKTIGKNEKSGLFGFVSDKVKEMFNTGKDKAGNWFNEVSGYFDYRTEDEKKEGDTVADKRKKLIASSVGAMTGLGLLGGPVGIIMGAVAGNALGTIPSIGEKLKEKLFGKDEDGKPTGLLSKAADAVISPIQYQFHKTMSFLGDKLKKNIVGPLSDIGYVLKNRITNKVEGIFGKFFHGMLNLGAKALGGIGKLGAKIFEGVISIKGIQSRGKIGAITGMAGWGMNRVADILSLGTPGLHKELSKRRKERNDEIEERSEKFKGGYKGWLSRKYAKNKDNNIDDLAEYTHEQVVSTKEIKESNDEVASNTGRTVEILSDIRDRLNGKEPEKHFEGKETEKESSVSTSDQHNSNIIQFPGSKSSDKKSAEKEDNSTFGESIITAGTTAAALSGFDDGEIKDISDIERSTNRGESKGSIFSKFKSLLKKNKDKENDESKKEDKKESSFLSKLIGGVGNIFGSLFSEYWPYLLGGLTLLSDDFRGMLFDVGGWLLKELPSTLGFLGGIGESINTNLEAKAFDAELTKDEVTNETKAVVSAEAHSEHIKKGALKSAFDSTMDFSRLAKDQMVIGAGKTVGRGVLWTAQGIGHLTKGGGVAVNIAKASKSAVANTVGYISNYGLKGSGHALVEYAKEATTSKLGNAMTKIGTRTASGAGFLRQSLQGVKGTFKNIFRDPRKLLLNSTGLMAGFTADVTSGIAWDYIETKKNAHIVGDYGFGNAGGYVMTNTKVKTGVAFASSMGASIAAGAILKAAGYLTVSAAGAASTGAGVPVGLILIILAGVAVVAAIISAVANWLTGWLTDKSDKKYAIRSNASKLQGVIDGRVNYVNGQENPIYVYCGRESDRVLGLTKGLNIANPDIVYGRYFKSIMDGLTSAPGAEVLLYDWVNNMAVQGVPFACWVAGDSDEAEASGEHANVNTTGDPPTDRNGPIGGQYTRVRKSTVVKNKDAIFADIANNINRQDPQFLWTPEDMKLLYDAGKEVVDSLKSKGILDNKGKIKTSTLKGSPLDKKPSSGWKGLQELCRSNGLYFLTKCLVYINSKIEANKDGQQWLEDRKDDIADLFETLMDVIKKENSELVETMKSQGMDDKEIEETLKEMADPKGPKAVEAGEISYADDPVISSISNDIKQKDAEDVKKEVQYIAAAYAYSHPSYLQRWVEKNRSLTTISVDDVQNISNWDEYTNDNRKKKSLRSQMRSAALAFGEQAGDIFDLIPKFDWSRDGKIYGRAEKKADKYGAAFVLRGQETKEGEGILDNIFEGLTDYTPTEVHDKMYGRETHGKGAESKDAKGQDWTIGGNGVMARIAEKMEDYGSDEGEQLAQGDHAKGWRNILVNLPASSPVNLPSDVSASRPASDKLMNFWNSNNSNDTTDDAAVGGPNDSLPSTVALNDGGGGSLPVEEPEEESTVQEGGNPLDKPFKITSRFGPRSHPHSGNHEGIDLIPSNGGESQVGSRFEGVVTEVKRDVPDTVRAKKTSDGKWEFPYNKNLETGNMVAIRAKNGMIIKNMHLKAGSIPNSISPGAKVNIGQRIGTMGSTGWSTGNHLHYEFRDPGNRPIDPTDSLASSASYTKVNEDNEANKAENENLTKHSYENSSSVASTTSYNYDQQETTESKGWLATLLDGLRDLGNQALFKITGGLAGSNGEDTGDNANGTITGNGTITASNTNTYISAFSSDTKYLTGNSNSQWLRIVRDVKRLVADQRPEYNQSGYMNITYNGKTLKVRTDCTGIICAMLKFYGVMGDNDNLNSTLMLGAGAIKKGFDQANFPGWDKLVEGDILVVDGHAEIFAFNEGSNHYVYNGGSTNALCSPGATRSSRKSYTKIWRCKEEVATNPAVTADASTIGNSDSDSVYKELKKYGYSDAAAAGVLGTWEAESRNKSKTVEGDYVKGYPGYDKVMNDNESMTAYTRDFLFGAYERSGKSIDKTAYVGTDGHLYPGIGLAQWTGPRHQKLKEYADSRHKDWRDMKTQVEYMDYEKASRNMDDSFKEREDPAQAAEEFARLFEGTNKAGMLKERKEKAQSFYAKYANSSNEEGTSDDPSASTDGVGGPTDDAYIFGSSLGNSNYNRRTTTTRKYQNVGGTNIPSTSIRSTSSNGTSITPDSPNRGQEMGNAEVVSLLRDVLLELRAINGNTGNSNTLLKSIGDNGIVDKGLRDQLSSIKPNRSSGSRSSNNRSYNPNHSSNVKLVNSMVRPQ